MKFRSKLILSYNPELLRVSELEILLNNRLIEIILNLIHLRVDEEKSGFLVAVVCLTKLSRVRLAYLESGDVAVLFAGNLRSVGLDLAPWRIKDAISPYRSTSP